MGKPIAHHILETPRDIHTGIVKPAKGHIITRADDLFFIESRVGALEVYIGLGVLMLLFGVLAMSHNEPLFDINILSIFTLIVMLIGIYMIILGAFKPKKNMQVSLDRIQGIITFPAAFFQKPVVGSFKELEAYFVASAGADGYANSEELRFRDTFSKKPGALLTASYKDPYNEWSLYVWYMDKNRPLPPGTGFDPYRQQDFERRKAEGFPRPLYASAIPTPEATPEQQAERKLIGGW